jgi:hypothetical protein
MGACSRAKLKARLAKSNRNPSRDATGYERYPGNVTRLGERDAIAFSARLEIAALLESRERLVDEFASSIATNSANVNAL